MKWLNCYRMRLMFVGFVAAIGLGGASANADFTWTQKADMPTPRWTHTSAVFNGKIYVIGGASSEPGSRVLSAVEEYDPATNTWTTKTDMPTARSDMLGSSAVVDGKIYVIGGCSSEPSWIVLSTVEAYDPATDTWTRKADMPTRRWSLGTCALDGKIYAIGGAPSNSYTGLNVVEQYDPATDTWTRKADMPIGVWGLFACVVDGKIYAIGGRVSGAVPLVQEYDPSTDTWTRKADMPVATGQMGSALLGNKIVLIGGWRTSGSNPYRTIQIYDPETDMWTIEADAPFRRATVTGEVVDNRIYIIGGTDRVHPCPATSTVYELTINPPPPDFNGDEIVDSVDMCIMVDHWGTSEPLCDIAPMPWGDGIVDVQDLIVLAEHLFEEIFPFELVAYWKLDETEGDIAYDSIGVNAGICHGEPLWQPDGGKIGGALEFDGIDDYIGTDFVLSPADGAFSAFAWIKDGAPGQVILSQAGSVNWLMAEAIDGVLKTDLKEPATLGRNRKPPGPPLTSSTVITDGDWHRVGFVRDGSNRILYVDDIEVARDTATNLEAASGGLYIGADKTLDAGTFFSGLIDDIRIYNRAVSP